MALFFLRYRIALVVFLHIFFYLSFCERFQANNILRDGELQNRVCRGIWLGGFASACRKGFRIKYVLRISIYINANESRSDLHEVNDCGFRDVTGDVE